MRSESKPESNNRLHSTNSPHPSKEYVQKSPLRQQSDTAIIRYPGWPCSWTIPCWAKPYILGVPPHNSGTPAQPTLHFQEQPHTETLHVIRKGGGSPTDTGYAPKLKIRLSWIGGGGGWQTALDASLLPQPLEPTRISPVVDPLQTPQPLSLASITTPPSPVT